MMGWVIYRRLYFFCIFFVFCIFLYFCVDQPGDGGGLRKTFSYYYTAGNLPIQYTLNIQCSYLVTCWRYLLMMSSRAFWCSSSAARSSLFSCCSVRICLKSNHFISWKILHKILADIQFCALQANVRQLSINLM